MKEGYKIIICSFFLILNTITCAKNNEVKRNDIKQSKLEQKSDCEENLNKLFYTSDFVNKEKYNVKFEEVRNDTILIKAYKKNNLSDVPQKQQIVESVVGWFIIPPNRDELYLSLNALDPEVPNFKKIKTEENLLKKIIACYEQKKNNVMSNINFTDLFNEGTNIKFTPKDLDKKDVQIQNFKKNLELFEKENPLPEDFDNKNLFSLINNETFFDLQYFTDSSWLQYFILKYKIDVKKLNELMKNAIEYEDYNSVKILIENNYIVSQKDLKAVEETELEVKEKIKSNKEDGYDSYLETKSKIREISELFINYYKKNHIQDPDGFTNLRKNKTTTSEVLQKVKSGEKIEVLDNSGDWFLVQTKEGKKGYVHRSRVK